MTDLKGARKQAALTQEKLAKLLRTDQASISDFERGNTIMSVKRAKKLGDVLGVSPKELRAENAALVLKRAFREGDPGRALDACKEIVLIAADSNLSDAQERQLDALVEAVTKFAENPSSLVEDDDDLEDLDEEDYGDDPERDYYGRVIPKEQRWSLKRAEESEGWEEEYGADPERDVYGRAIFVKKSADASTEDDEEFEVDVASEDEVDDTDEESYFANPGRDHYGRAIIVPREEG